MRARWAPACLPGTAQGRRDPAAPLTLPFPRPGGITRSFPTPFCPQPRRDKHKDAHASSRTAAGSPSGTCRATDRKIARGGCGRPGRTYGAPHGRVDLDISVTCWPRSPARSPCDPKSDARGDDLCRTKEPGPPPTHGRVSLLRYSTHGEWLTRLPAT